MTIRHGMVAAGTMLAATLSASAGSLEIQPVADNVFALVGGKEQRSPDNFANNATFGVVVTDEGIVLHFATDAHKLIEWHIH